MTPEQAAAYVIAQAACANAEVAAMQAQDRVWIASKLNTYSDLDYLHVIDKYAIGHNAVLTLFQEAV